MRVLVARTTAVVMAVALVGAACSDDKKSGLTKADWIKAAAAICAQGTEDFEVLFEDFPTTPEATVDFLKKAAPIVEREVTELRKLDAPEEIADDVDAALASGDQAVEEIQAASTSVEKAGELFSAEGGENLQAFTGAMTDLGVPECDEDEGGEEDSPERLDPSTFSPEKATFVEAADAICAEANEATRPAEDEYLADFPPPLEKWVGFLGVVVPVLTEGLAALEALEPPADDAAHIDELIARQRALVGELEKMQAAAEAGDQETFDEVSSSVFNEFDELDAALVEYGFQVCGPDDEREDDEEDGEDGEGGGADEEDAE